jgi:glycosyltransferase involved in cell wall biosynthesis
LKIAVLGTRGYPYVYSGYETFISDLAPRLIAKGHEVTVYCHRSLFKEHPRAVNGVELVYVPAFEFKSFSQFSHSFLSTLHLLTRRPDIALFVNSANGPFGVLTTLFRIKSAINVDGVEWKRPKWKGLGSKYFYYSSWLSTKVFNQVVTDCHEMAKIYEKEFHRSSTTIAYGANIGQSKNPDLIRSLGLSGRDYYLVVGRLIPDNNVDLTVKAFERSSSKRKLVILGDVPYTDVYAREVRQTKDPRILFPGYVRDADLLRELYCNAYAYIHGHEFGGTNPSLLKALANGCCILALDTVFSREVLNDGEYGILFKKDVNALQEQLEKIDGNDERANSFRRKSRERIAERYTWDTITDQYESLFISMMQPRK